MNIPLGDYLMLSAFLFAIGLCGALSRKNAIIVLIGIEIMFNAGILNLIAFWHYKYFAVLTATCLPFSPSRLPRRNRLLVWRW